MLLFFFQSDIKVYSSESQSQPIKEKSIPLIDSLVQSVLDMIKLFQNSEFVNILTKILKKNLDIKFTFNR